MSNPAICTAKRTHQQAVSAPSLSVTSLLSHPQPPHTPAPARSHPHAHTTRATRFCLYNFNYKPLVSKENPYIYFGPGVIKLTNPSSLIVTEEQGSGRKRFLAIVWRTSFKNSTLVGFPSARRRQRRHVT